MTRQQLKRLLDYIPVVVLAILVSDMTYAWINDNIMLTYRHWLGIAFFTTTCIVVIINHQLGVLILGLTLIMGLFGITQYSRGVSITSVYWTPFDAKITLFYGVPSFLFWLSLHFVLSGRYYVGIFTMKYWNNLLNALKPSQAKRKS